jgi:hypothetical protein
MLESAYFLVQLMGIQSQIYSEPTFKMVSSKHIMKFFFFWMISLEDEMSESNSNFLDNKI